MASYLIGDKVRLILTNGFHYSGTILDDADLKIIIRDKRGVRVEISKSSIAVSEEVL